MQHRIFIAINLPENIKKELSSYLSKWPELPAKWVKKDNLHITLIFLGNNDDQTLLEISKIAQEVASKNEPFSVNLTDICYGPPKKIPPRMIWAKGEKSQALAQLKNDLEKSLMQTQTIRFTQDNKGFSPHITLARIRVWEWRRIEPEERPEVAETIDLNFSVESIEVMESRLKKGGAEYAVLDSFPLGEK